MFIFCASSVLCRQWSGRCHTGCASLIVCDLETSIVGLRLSVIAK